MVKFIDMEVMKDLIYKKPKLFLIMIITLYINIMEHVVTKQTAP